VCKERPDTRLSLSTNKTETKTKTKIIDHFLKKTEKYA
jgi:hypothetical protein